MERGKRVYFDEINIVKGIAMLTVIWHHSMIVYPVNLQALPWCQHAIAINHTYCLVVFFLVSGYLFAHSSNLSFFHTLSSKASRLLIPYLGFGAVNLAVKVLAPTLVNTKVESVGTYVWNMIFFGGELWFIYTLFLIFLIWSLFLQWLKRKQVVCLLVAVILLDQFLPEDIWSGLFMLHVVIYYSIWFLAGWLMKDVPREILCRGDFLFIVSIIFVCLCIIFVQSVRLPYVDMYVKGSVGCLFVWMLSFQITRYHILARPLGFIGRYSLAYYWLNGFVLVPARIVVVNVLQVQFTPLIAFSIWCICVTLITMAVLVVRQIPVVRNVIGIR